MDRIKKILAPTDLSEFSLVGVRYALKLAKDIGAEVTVYYVVDHDEMLRYAEQIKRGLGDYTFSPHVPVLEKYQLALARFLTDHFSDLIPWLKIQEKVEIGKAEKNIVERARSEGADLIVMSTHGRTGLSHMLVGSVTEKVVRTAPCPVLSIHPRAEEKAVAVA